VPKRQRKRGRLWLNDGSCIRLRPLYAGHVWSYDFVSARTHDGRPLKLLTVLDEYTRECMAIEVRRSMKAHHVLEALADLFTRHGAPKHLRSKVLSELGGWKEPQTILKCYQHPDQDQLAAALGTRTCHNGSNSGPNGPKVGPFVRPILPRRSSV
jgi:transposase InsO family protein